MNQHSRPGKVLGVALTVALAWSASANAEAQSQSLVDVVRRVTARFQDPADAVEAGYAMALGCVSGPQEGGMGLHFIKGVLAGDDQLDPEQPEALLYEPVNGRLQLVGVEYIVDAALWHQTNAGPPVLLGHLAHYVGSPNRYALSAFYELHVWAWKSNPKGTFADFNPRVSCAAYAPDGPAVAAANHVHGGGSTSGRASGSPPHGSRIER
jgi:hypothetical protein